MSASAAVPPPDQPPFMRVEEAVQYERMPGTPFIVKRGRERAGGVLGAEVAREWAQKQASFIRWTRDEAMFNEPDVRRNFDICAQYFRVHGPMSGRVLDIGGGWGLFREWWSGDGCFVVHDPGVERFTVQPPAVTRSVFRDGLAKPALFVEGFGERLPYVAAAYDVVLIASALDHCADPAQVLKEAARVLRPGGALLVIQGFDLEPGSAGARAASFGRRLLGVLSNPRRLYRAIRMRIFHRGEPHMHHFSREHLRAMTEGAGFVGYAETVLSERFGVAALSATKPR